MPKFARLERDGKVDIAVVGAGITGITTAYLFKRAGYTVALIERGRCGGFDTLNTTAHITAVTDSPLTQLAERFGKDGAWAAWQAGFAAMQQIASNIQEERIACDFKWVSGYRHLPGRQAPKAEHRALWKESELARELGFRANFLAQVPGLSVPGIEFEGQAKFHPAKYVAALLKLIPGRGSHVYENSQIREVQAKPLAVKTEQHKIRCQFVVVATHNPIMGRAQPTASALFQTKLFLYTTYAVGARIPSGELPEASYWDTGEPYHYLRIDEQRGRAYAVYGGEDHKTGQRRNTLAAYDRLEHKLVGLVKGAKVDHHWSGQVIETPDGLPYIGQTADRQFAATGFSGNGMTFGTLAAMMAVDAFLERRNPWAELFAPDRKVVHGGAWHYVKENADYPYYLLKDRFTKVRGKSLRSLKRNEGKILKLSGRKVAAYCDEQGKLTLRSPICTHLECVVNWNPVEKTWDCPCHGSRFAATGEVLAGPAEKPLERIALPKRRRKAGR
jgi:glycine/D-amino acid oxidase-like deaminating enzyme/nitrite reductase/ring-hydroxylating ferredoxin subunit